MVSFYSNTWVLRRQIVVNDLPDASVAVTSRHFITYIYGLMFEDIMDCVLGRFLLRKGHDFDFESQNRDFKIEILIKKSKTFK